MNIGIISSSQNNVPTTSSLLTGLIGYWNFDQNSNTLTDVVSGRNGTNTGGIVNQTGILGKCVQYDTNTDRVVVPNNAAFIPASNTLSVSLWAKVSAWPASTGYLCSMFDNAGSVSAYAITINSTGGIFGIVLNQTPTQYNSFSGAGVMTLNVWHHIVLVMRGAGYPIQLYVDNVKYETGVNFTGTIHAASGGLLWGTQYGNASGIIGFIDEPGVWGKALTSDEVASLYNSGIGRTHPFNP